MIRVATAKDVEVHFVQVGQGDATLVIDRDSSEALLIDCPAGRESAVEKILTDAGSPTLKAVILTHWDRDHYGGIVSLLRSTQAETFYYNHDTILAWDGPVTLRRAALLELLEPELESVRHLAAHRGVAGSLGSRIQWRLLAPYYDDLTRGAAGGDRNSCSGIVEILAGSRRFLIGGDADGRVWQRLVDDGTTLKCNVLKWPHHGAINPRGGLDEAGLMAHTRPDYVVFSVGSSNRYGHPAAAAIDAAARTRMGCTEVTPRCHPQLASGGTACGGTMALVVEDDDSMRETAGWTTLDARVSSWDQPQCVQRSPAAAAESIGAES